MDGFEVFFDEQYEGVVRSLTIVFGDRATAEDAAQAGFEKALRKWRLGGPAVRRRHRNLRTVQVGAAIVTVVALIAGVAMWRSSDTASSGLHVVTGPTDTLPVDAALARCFPTLAAPSGSDGGPTDRRLSIVGPAMGNQHTAPQLLWTSPDPITALSWSGSSLAVVHGNTLSLVSPDDGHAVDVATLTGRVRDLDWSR